MSIADDPQRTQRRLAEAHRWGQRLAQEGRDREHVEARIAARGTCLTEQEADAVRSAWKFAQSARGTA